MQIEFKCIHWVMYKIYKVASNLMNFPAKQFNQLNSKCHIKLIEAFFCMNKGVQDRKLYHTFLRLKFKCNILNLFSNEYEIRQKILKL